MSIQIQENEALAPLTTMRAGGNARFFVQVKSSDDIREALLWAGERELPVFILGGGSNTLVPDEGFGGLVIKIEIKGITYNETEEGVRVTVGGGEIWDNVVRDVVSRNLWGIENLSLIPGCVGGAVVQNIGAYGVEAREIIFCVEAFDTLTMKIKTFSNKECMFGYRESIFKKNNHLIVISASFDLVYDGASRLDYEDVKKYFNEKEIVIPTLVEIRDAVVAIRTAKMPAPPIGTAGSFFKNPIISEDKFEDLKKQFPEIKAYPQADGTVKLSAAWLLDKVGNFRGVRRGDAGVHERQALILVNYGSATTRDIRALAEVMKREVKEKTGVVLEEEVVILGSH